MTDFMYSCVNKREKEKVCEVTARKHLKFPPVKLENNKYDFGVEIYSDLFNKLPIFQQDTYLTFYSNSKDDNKNILCYCTQ
jgi:uncharacterized FAD-dependent dehydrogenase